MWPLTLIIDGGRGFVELLFMDPVGDIAHEEITAYLHMFVRLLLLLVSRVVSHATCLRHELFAYIIYHRNIRPNP